MAFFKNNSITQIIYSSTSVKNSDIDDQFILFSKFESAPLIDEISGNKFVISSSGQDNIFVDSGAFGNALRMKPLTELSYLFESPIFTSFSLGFWLKPVNVAPTINTQTGIPNFYRMGLIDRAQFQLSSSGMIETVPDETDFVVYEECVNNGKNTMYILLESSEGGSVIYKTSEYKSGLFHYFWIAYSGPAGQLRVFIDGVSDNTTLVEGDGVPSSLNSGTSTPLHINRSAIGHNTLLRGNFGMLDELVFQKNFISDTETIARHINLGSEFVINKSLSNTQEVYQAFTYDDPTTIDISSIYSNGKNIYVGRTDGKVFKGDRTMWRSRKDFSNREEINFIKKRLLSSDAVVDVENGALKLLKASARI